MRNIIIGVMIFILIYLEAALIDFFTNSNLQQVYYEYGVWVFLKKSVIKTSNNLATLVSSGFF